MFHITVWFCFIILTVQKYYHTDRKPNEKLQNSVNIQFSTCVLFKMSYFVTNMKLKRIFHDEKKVLDLVIHYTNVFFSFGETGKNVVFLSII